jgi:putative transposase
MAVGRCSIIQIVAKSRERRLSALAVRGRMSCQEKNGSRSGFIDASSSGWYRGGLARLTRCSDAGYYVLNRAAGRAALFAKPSDYAAFERVLRQAWQRIGMRPVGFAIMPNHWHPVVWPREDGELSNWAQWLTVTHVRRWHAHHQSDGTGPIHQGRFKSFPVQEDDHYFRLCRYVERNPLRANLVARAEQWRWSSLWLRVHAPKCPGCATARCPYRRAGPTM